MLLIILSLIDIITGLFLLFPNIFPTVSFYLGIIVLIKGLCSIGGSLLAKDWIVLLGIIDLIAGLMLIFNFSFPWFWMLMILKGIYCLIVGFGSR